MSKVIVFCGKSGSGKTTLAKKLAKELNIFCLSKDTLKETLYDLYGGKTLDDSNYHGKQSIFLLTALAEEAIRMSVDIILEAPFSHPDNVAQFKRWQKDANIDFSLFVCAVDEDTRTNRMIERRDNRHVSHHEAERFKLGHYSLEHFDYTAMPDPKIFLDTSRGIDELFQEVLSACK
jgi:predicted kinase